MAIKLLMDLGVIIISVLTLFGILYAASGDTQDLNKDLHRDHTDLVSDHDKILALVKEIKNDTNTLNAHQGIIQSQLTNLSRTREEKITRLNGLIYEQAKVDDALSKIAHFNEVMQRAQTDNQRLIDEKRLLEVKVQTLKQENEKLTLALAQWDL